MVENQQDPEVSVVCAWYNRSKYIHDTVDSLLKQAFERFEVIIVNDGSTDPGVHEILDSYDDKRLRIIHQKNTGFTVAIRRAIAESNAPYIAIQGAGDVSHPKRLKTQWTLMKDNSEIAASGVGYRITAPDSIKKGKYVEPVSFLNENILNYRMPFTHGSAMYSRRAYIESGGYDCRFKYCQDRDLFYRLLRVGKIVGINKQLYEKRAFPDGVTFSPEKKLLQRWYGSVARDRKISSRESKLNKAKQIESAMDLSKARHIPLSVRFYLGSIYRNDISNRQQWGAKIRLQIKNAVLLKW